MSASYFGDLKNSALQAQLAPPALVISTATTTTGTGVDMILGDGNNCSVLLNIGVYDVSSTDETYSFDVQESDDNSTGWSSVKGLDGGSGAAVLLISLAGKTLITGVAAGTAGLRAFNFQRTKRYLRLVVITAGTTPNLYYTAI